MKKSLAILFFTLLLVSCKTTTDKIAPFSNTDLGHAFVDAFYSFNRDSLRALLSSAQQSQPEILYYQTWAKCGNYQVIDRSRSFEKNDSLVIFPVTVKDDLIGALRLDFNVTDTFHISIKDGKIVSVKTSSNDPDVYYEAKEWVKMNRPEWVEKACEGIWQGGPTPCECVQGMIKGFTEFIENKKVAKP
jgi:hypothetical protein